MICNSTVSQPHRPLTSAEDVQGTARRGTRGLLAAIGLGLVVWLLTGVAVSMAILR